MKPPLVLPCPPVKVTTLSTAGSLLMTDASCRDRIVHHGEGGILRSLQTAEDDAGVLLREEAFGNFDDDHHVQRDDQNQDHQHQHGVVEHPVKRAAIDGEHPVEEAVAHLVQAAVLFVVRFEQVARTSLAWW